MRKLLFIVFALSGCTSVVQTPEALLAQPIGDVYQVKFESAAPVEIVYKNILAQARRCWGPSGMRLENDAYDKQVGYASISLRNPSSMTMQSIVFLTARMAPNQSGGTSVIARTHLGLYKFYVKNLESIAAGKETECESYD